MGEIEYFPSDVGFDSAYYPYMNDDGYRSPLIAVRFKEPAPFQFLHVECRAWAGNIKYHRRDRVGIAHFELMMHTDETAKKVDGALAMYELMYFVVHKLKESRNKPAVIRNVMHFLVKSRLNIHIFACNVMCVK